MSNDHSSQSGAEQTDSTKLGETVGDSDPVSDSYPPDEPLGVEDPDIRADGSIAPDNVATREDRLQPETGQRPRDQQRRDIMDTSSDPDRLDDESEMIAEESDTTSSAAEVTAIHDVPE